MVFKLKEEAGPVLGLICCPSAPLLKAFNWVREELHSDSFEGFILLFASLMTEAEVLASEAEFKSKPMRQTSLRGGTYQFYDDI